MKKIVFLFLFLICFEYNSFAQENSIWGVWNYGDREHSRILTTVDGSFLWSWDYLTFQSYYYNSGPRISEQGYSYDIKEIIINEGNLVSLYIETRLQNLGSHPTVNAKIVMHFIDQDHMWMEVDRGDEKYPTDSRFDGAPFNKGHSVIFWRERVK
jgi:hypothetical protein